MIYLQLFLSFFKIGLFSFGGGYAALPLIQNEVMTYHWLTSNEFTDLITISQMTPGPIAINAATFIGVKVAGFMGAVVATIGNILPSCIIVTCISYLYLKYRKLDTFQKILKTLRPAVVALIATAGLSIMINSFFSNGIFGVSTFHMQAVVIFGISLFLLLKKKMNPILVMVLSGFLNVGYMFLTGMF